MYWTKQCKEAKEIMHFISRSPAWKSLVEGLRLLIAQGSWCSSLVNPMVSGIIMEFEPTLLVCLKDRHHASAATPEEHCTRKWFFLYLRQRHTNEFPTFGGYPFSPALQMCLWSIVSGKSLVQISARYSISDLRKATLFQ